MKLYLPEQEMLSLAIPTCDSLLNLCANYYISPVVIYKSR